MPMIAAEKLVSRRSSGSRPTNADHCRAFSLFSANVVLSPSGVSAGSGVLRRSKVARIACANDRQGSPYSTPKTATKFFMRLTASSGSSSTFALSAKRKMST